MAAEAALVAWGLQRQKEHALRDVTHRFCAGQKPAAAGLTGQARDFRMSKRRRLIELAAWLWNDPPGPLGNNRSLSFRAVEARGKVGSNFGPPRPLRLNSFQVKRRFGQFSPAAILSFESLREIHGR